MSANATPGLYPKATKRLRPLKAEKTDNQLPSTMFASSEPSPSSRRKADSQLSTTACVSSVVPTAEPVDSQHVAVTQTWIATAGLSLIKELHRRRQDFLNAEGALTRQIKAIERRMQASTMSSPSSETSASVPSNGGNTGLHNPVSLVSGAGVSSDLSWPDNHGGFIGGDAGQDDDANQHKFASVSSDQCARDDQARVVGGDAGHCASETQHKTASVSSNLVTLQLQVAEDHIRKQRKLVERELVKAAKELPVYSAFVEPINGFGALGLAQIIGEAGDLAKYSNPAKLWKRFGLGLVGGERQRRHTDPEKAIAHGYSPRRRSVMFVIGDSLLKKQNAYKDLYDERKRYEEQKAIAAGLVVRAAKPGDPVDQVSAGFRSKMVIHRRSQRYVEKRLLRDLWRSWRDHRSRVCR